MSSFLDEIFLNRIFLYKLIQIQFKVNMRFAQTHNLKKWPVFLNFLKIQPCLNSSLMIFFLSHYYFFILFNRSYCILKLGHMFSIFVNSSILFLIHLFNWFEQFCFYIFFCFVKVLIRGKVLNLWSKI